MGSQRSSSQEAHELGPVASTSTAPWPAADPDQAGRTAPHIAFEDQRDRLAELDEDQDSAVSRRRSGERVREAAEEEGQIVKEGDEGVRRRRRRERRNSTAPSYAQSEFIEITRRQRVRSHDNALKLPRHLLAPSRSRSPATPSPSRPLRPSNPSRRLSSDSATSAAAAGLDALPDLPCSTSSARDPPKLPNSWEFAGWGTMSYLELSAEEVEQARERRREEMKRDGEGVLGAWLASGVAGVAVAGSPLYAFPALVAVASVYSPISLFVATLLLAFWRPIMTELAAALPISGANYAYLLNSSRNLTFALFAASLTLLDDIATSVVAAATAAQYIADQGVPNGSTWLTIVLLGGVCLIGLVGVRGSASVTLATLAIHLVTLSILFVAAVVYWGRHGNAQLASNWEAGQLPTPGGVARAIYKGVCVAFLGVTGWETAPDYVSSLRPDRRTYPRVLRSLQVIAVCINAPLLLVVFAVLPMEDILGNASVLSALGKRSAHKWLGLLVTVDAVLILCATILAGLVSAIALLHRLSLDGYLPRLVLKPLPFSGVPSLVVGLFAALCLVVYTSSGCSLDTVSNMFALVFLAVMTLYPLSLLLMRYNRPSLPPSSAPKTPFLLVLFTLCLSFALISGVIWNQPVSLGLFAAYKVALFVAVLACARKGTGLRYAWWVCQHGVGWTSGAEWCVRMMKKSKEGKDVVLFVKSDEINTLFERISYVEQNEDLARVKLVHFYGQSSSASRLTTGGAVDATKSKEEIGVEDGEATPEQGTGMSSVDDIPSELEANFRILDEAFPSITIDLVFLRAPFSPPYIHALAHRLSIPVARCFMGSPSSSWSDEREWGVRELAGVRVISD
ncbi:hypothetical protein JCM8097_007054 [Rhodosporidiobolus ruineniae]